MSYNAASIARPQQTKPYAKLTPDRIAIVLQAIEAGYSLSGAARQAGIDPTTLYRHRATDPELERAIEERKPIRLDVFVDAMREKALQPNGFLANAMYLKALDRATWGDHVDVRQQSLLRIEIVAVPSAEELMAEDARLAISAPLPGGTVREGALDAEYVSEYDADDST